MPTTMVKAMPAKQAGLRVKEQRVGHLVLVVLVVLEAREVLHRLLPKHHLLPRIVARPRERQLVEVVAVERQVAHLQGVRCKVLAVT